MSVVDGSLVDGPLGALVSPAPDTAACHALAAAASSSRINRKPAISDSTLVDDVYLPRSMRDKIDLEGIREPPFPFAALPPLPSPLDAASLIRFAMDRSAGCKSTVSGTRQAGHVTFAPFAVGAQDAYSVIHAT